MLSEFRSSGLLCVCHRYRISDINFSANCNNQSNLRFSGELTRLPVAGITAASGIAAELGIPLTHRGIANSVRFLTGHSRKGGTDPLYVAENAADPETTLVVYMGLGTLPSLARKLTDHGLPGDTPAAAIERGTTPRQRTVSQKSSYRALFKENQRVGLGTGWIFGLFESEPEHFRFHEILSDLGFVLARVYDLCVSDPKFQEISV